MTNINEKNRKEINVSFSFDKEKLFFFLKENNFKLSLAFNNDFETETIHPLWKNELFLGYYIQFPRTNDFYLFNGLKTYYIGDCIDHKTYNPFEKETIKQEKNSSFRCVKVETLSFNFNTNEMEENNFEFLDISTYMEYQNIRITELKDNDIQGIKVYNLLNENGLFHFLDYKLNKENLSNMEKITFPIAVNMIYKFTAVLTYHKKMDLFLISNRDNDLFFGVYRNGKFYPIKK